MCKIEELLQTKPSKEDYPRILYRGDWLQRAGCYCSGLVPKYAQRFCRQRGEPSVKGDDLLEQIKPILKRYLQGLSWWDKMKDPISNWDALVLAQHYGLDTRFLDWSSNPRVALYFATHKFENGRCVPKRKDDGDSVIWICDLKGLRDVIGRKVYRTGMLIQKLKRHRFGVMKTCGHFFTGPIPGTILANVLRTKEASCAGRSSIQQTRPMGSVA